MAMAVQGRVMAEMVMAVDINNFRNIMPIKSNWYLIITFLLLSQKAFSQFSFETAFENYYDNNIYNNSLNVEDFVNSFNYSSAFNIESDYNNLQFYYMGNLSYYQKNIFKSSNSHKLGIVNTYLLSEYDNPINIGVNYSLRNNREDFEVFNFDQLSAYSNYRHSFSESNKLILGYIFNRNNYKNFSIFSHNEHKAFLKSIFGFETGTSILLGAEFNFKDYWENIQSDIAANSNSQLNFSANLAQSIDNNTGIALNVSYRKNLTSGTRYINSGEFVYYEEEIFNDLYSNEGYQTGILFSKYLSEAVFAKVEFIYSHKNYLNIPATNIEGYDLSENRLDNQFAGGIGLEFDLSPVTSGLTLEANWNYIYNKSNDYYYNYSNQLLSVGFNWGF